MIKKHVIKLFMITLLSFVTISLSFAGWLTMTGNKADGVTFGDVVVEVLVSYETENGTFQGNPFYVAETKEQGSFTKTGIYKIDISSPDSPQFIKNLRVKISVSSKVDTYFRIAAYEQLTLSYQSGDNKYEIAITQPERMPFKYKSQDNGVNPYFFDNRDNDGFFYYTSMVKRNPNTSSKEIIFIDEFGLNPFTTYESSYSLQLGFIVEAVQSVGGPNINWGLPIRPWDNEVWTV